MEAKVSLMYMDYVRITTCSYVHTCMYRTYVCVFSCECQSLPLSDNGCLLASSVILFFKHDPSLNLDLISSIYKPQEPHVFIQHMENILYIDTERSSGLEC